MSVPDDQAGKSHWARQRNSPLALIATRNMREQLLAERLLEESEQRYKSLFEDNPDADGIFW